MHKLQEEQMRDYVKEIEQSGNKPETMHRILKKEDRLFFKIVDVVFLVLIFGGIVYAYLHGAYDKTEITVDPNGVICQTNKPSLYPIGNILLPNMTTKPTIEKQIENSTGRLT